MTQKDSRSKGFWFGEAFKDEQSDKFVARYVERGPVSLEKLSIVDDLVVYSTKDGASNEFEPLEFLALLSSHIPNTYESITRYYGWYSCRARGERKKLALQAEKEQAAKEQLEPLPSDISEPEEPVGRASSSWALCIKQVYEIDPLECPKCKSQMRIIAFVNDPQEVKQIMKSLGLPDYRAPPPLPKGPGTIQEFELHFDSMPDYDA